MFQTRAVWYWFLVEVVFVEGFPVAAVRVSFVSPAAVSLPAAAAPSVVALCAAAPNVVVPTAVAGRASFVVPAAVFLPGVVAPTVAALCVAVLAAVSLPSAACLVAADPTVVVSVSVAPPPVGR